MKCICGFEGEGVRVFIGKEMDATGKTDEFEQYGIYGKSKSLPLDGDLIALFACEKCGTIKIDYGYNPLLED